MAVLLILCEGLARETGNAPMVTLASRPDGTGRASFTAQLDDIDHIDPLSEN